MAKVTMICGKICCGKSTYAARLCRGGRAVLLSIDEIMLALFGQHVGEMHDTYVERTERHLLGKTAELIAAGTDVVLDWGFWTRAERESVRQFFAERGIACEVHAIDISHKTWQARLKKRNTAVEAGMADAYYIDENIAAKFAAIFEEPSPEEIDVHLREADGI